MLVVENKKEFMKLIKESFNELAREQEYERLNCTIYSKKQTAEMLRVSYTKIQTLIKNGYLRLTQDKAFITFESIKEYTGSENITCRIGNHTCI